VAEAQVYRQFRWTLPTGACDMLLVRHGESAPEDPDDPFPTVDGQGDPELDPVGHQQAELLADRLASEKISAIYVTTLRRTAQTAAPLAARLGLEPVVEPDLREVFLGEWETTFRRRIAEGGDIVKRMYAEERWDAIPGAESSEAFAKRLQAGINRIAAAHPGETVMVVTHGGALGQIFATATGARPFALSTDNCSLSRLVVTPERWILRAYNDTTHLGPLT
jgi:2,3-bisphosphoglycerate-dependent phosphoglycerate mutase